MNTNGTKHWIWLALLFAGCAGMARDCSGCTASSFGACVGFAAGAASARNSPTLVPWLLVMLIFVVLAVQRVRLIETSARIDEIERRERP